MIAANYSNVREAFKEYCDRVNDEAETLIVTRKSGGNIVILSEDNYNNIIENMYLRSNPVNYARLIASIDQAKNGARRTRELDEDE